MFCGKIRGSSEIIYGVFRNNTNLLFSKRKVVCSNCLEEVNRNERGNPSSV